MSDKIEELALPSAVIARILKDAIPDGISISKEARTAVTRAASVFVLYTTACASQIQAASQRKTLNVTDVYSALEDMMFEDMIDPVKESLEAFHADKGKKTATVGSPTKTGVTPKLKRKRSQSAGMDVMNVGSNVELSTTELQGEESKNSADTLVESIPL